jgi:hypothetical protein
MFVLAAACSSGGGSEPLPPLEQQSSLGVVRADAPTEMAIQVPNPLDAEASVEEVAGVAGGPFAIGTLPATVASNGEATIPIVFTPPGPGDHEGEIRVRFVAPSSEREVVLKLFAQVETPTLSLLTPTLAFLPTLVGEERSLEIRAQNRSVRTPVQVTSIGALPGGFNAGFAPRTLIPGDTLRVLVTYEPMAPGDFDFQLDIAHDAGAPLRVRITARSETWIPEQIVDFGNVTLVNGETPWLEVNLPPHAISLSIEALAPSSAAPGLLGLEGPGGRIYENDQATGAYIWNPGYGGIFTATVPNTDRTDVQLVPGGGRYRFRLFVFDGSAGSFGVRAIVENRTGGVATSGRLDLNVFVADGLSIADPETDARLASVLTRMDDIFAQVGLGVGKASYYRLTDSSFDNVSGSEFEALLAQSSSASERRVNLFFVREALGGGVLGVAGGIAGPARNGTTASGVMVDYDFDTPTAVGQVAAHEVGHYLGLWHTAEQTPGPGAHDFIDDTLECPATGTDATCPTVGGGYLMHWQYFDSSLPEITPGQALVILGHPLVDPVSALAGLAQRRAPEEAFVVLPPGFCATCARTK